MSVPFIAAAVAVQPRKLNDSQQTALIFSDRIRSEVETEGYIPSAYYKHHTWGHSYGNVRGPYFIWMGGCGGGGSKKGNEVVAAILFIFLSIMTFIQGVLSSRKSKEYSNLAGQAATGFRAVDHNSHEFTIYNSAKIIMDHASAERTASALSQYVMAVGFAMLSVALIMAYASKGYMTPPNIEKLLTYGAGLSVAGILGYTITQIHYYFVRLPEINLSYIEMNRKSAELEALRQGQSLTILVMVATGIKEEQVAPPRYEEPNHPPSSAATVQQPDQTTPSGSPPSYEEPPAASAPAPEQFTPPLKPSIPPPANPAAIGL